MFTHISTMIAEGIYNVLPLTAVLAGCGAVLLGVNYVDRRTKYKYIPVKPAPVKEEIPMPKSTPAPPTTISDLADVLPEAVVELVKIKMGHIGSMSRRTWERTYFGNTTANGAVTGRWLRMLGEPVRRPDPAPEPAATLVRHDDVLPEGPARTWENGHALTVKPEPPGLNSFQTSHAQMNALLTFIGLSPEALLNLSQPKDPDYIATLNLTLAKLQASTPMLADIIGKILTPAI